MPAPSRQRRYDFSSRVLCLSGTASRPHSVARSQIFGTSQWFIYFIQPSSSIELTGRPNVCVTPPHFCAIFAGAEIATADLVFTPICSTVLDKLATYIIVPCHPKVQFYVQRDLPQARLNRTAATLYKTTAPPYRHRHPAHSHSLSHTERSSPPPGFPEGPSSSFESASVPLPDRSSII